MSIQPTTTLDSASWESLERAASTGLALVILWLRGELSRVGEVAFLPRSRTPVILGRGPGEDKLDFLRLRPGEVLPTGPLTAPRLSREQLSLQVAGEEVRVRLTGRGELRVDGVAVSEARVRPGQLIEVRNQLLLALLRLPVSLPRAPHLGPPTHAFGTADAHGLVGESPAAWALRADLAFLAAREGHVLVLGPSGTGKELASRALHALSPRSQGSFVGRSAATLPRELVDAELFGHARDYPNAGMPARVGLVGEAHGGTLFLDEIGELPMEAQTHLLRVLDAGEYHRLGESQARHTDLRVVAATNRPLAALREDLVARFAFRV